MLVIALLAAVLTGVPMWSVAQYYKGEAAPPAPAGYPAVRDTAGGVTLTMGAAPTVPDGYDALVDDKRAYDLATPSNIVTQADYDPETGCYIVRTRVGSFDIATPFMLSPVQYNDWQFRRSMQDYYRKRNA